MIELELRKHASRGYVNWLDKHDGEVLCGRGLDEYFHIPAKIKRITVCVSVNKPNHDSAYHCRYNGHSVHIQTKNGRARAVTTWVADKYLIQLDSPSFYVWIEYTI